MEFAKSSFLGNQKIPAKYIHFSKGVFNLANQPSNISKKWGTHRGNTKFYEFHWLIIRHVAIHVKGIPTISTGKHMKLLLEISLETMIWGNNGVNIADFGLKKWMMI